MAPEQTLSQSLPAELGDRLKRAFDRELLEDPEFRDYQFTTEGQLVIPTAQEIRNRIRHATGYLVGVNERLDLGFKRVTRDTDFLGYGLPTVEESTVGR